MQKKEAYKYLPDNAIAFLDAKNSVLLETVRCDDANYLSYIFIEPVAILKLDNPEGISELFNQIEEYLEEGYWLAGYFAYECGFCLEQITLMARRFASLLAWFGVYKNPVVFNHRTGDWINLPEEKRGLNPLFLETDNDFAIGNLSFGTVFGDGCKKNYLSKIRLIKNYIASGDVYQVNFTDRFRFDFRGSVDALYKTLKKKQKVAYGALIKTENETILSFSPELFLKLDGNMIKTEPMKGTARRGRTLSEDNAVRDWLRNDEKSKAENLMIVDLLRNDLGRVAEVGTVKVPKLFTVKRYETLWQMTSTIEGKIKSDIGLYELFRALFPSGSVTGAPKISAMKLINELEDTPRGVYTGAIGYFAPKRKAVFNVAIRTIVIKDNKGIMGSGSGIVWDSLPEDEFDECLLKGKFLTVPANEDFHLIETILWEDGYRLLPKHMDRLTQSAEYFGFPLDLDSFAETLNRNGQTLQAGNRYKVRVTLSADGELTITNYLLTPDTRQDPGLVAIAETRVDSNDCFLYHKTSRRRLFDAWYAEALQKGYTDYIFLNEKGQVTEGTISNVFIKKGRRYLTPPVECGLLNGVYRQYLLEKSSNAGEKVLCLQDLLDADEIFVCNAIRGLRKVRLVE